MASIHTLASGVADELRASLVVHSLEQCAAELVQNSIDANASTIEVKVDIAGHSLQVSDNGDGITSADMARIGTRYATSKCSSLQDLKCVSTYGFRGEAVAAIAEMSLLDIVSRPREQNQVFSTIFKGGEKLFCGPSSKSPRYIHGTTISVRDLFYKFPVRQRYWSEASISKLDLELEKVKRSIEALALANPKISFIVVDMMRGNKILNCRKADSRLHRITAVFGQALSSSLTFVRSNAEDQTYSFTGYISTVGHYNRLFQFFFLNNRPIQCESLQKTVTQLFQQSSFSKDSLQHHDADVRRSRERYPVYVLSLVCPTSEYDICVDPAKSMVEFEDEERVLYLVRDTIISFLERQHLLSRSTAATLRSQTTTRKRKSRAKGLVGETLAPIEHFSHAKSSRPVRTTRTYQRAALEGLEGVSDTARSQEIDVEDEIEFELDSERIADMLNDDFEMSEMEYSRRSGSSIMLPEPMSKRPCSTRISLPHVTGPQSRSNNTRTSGIWAQDALRKWANPVFSTPPSHIPSLQTLKLNVGQGDTKKSMSRYFSTHTDQSSRPEIKSLQLSKSCLQQAQVVAQLDRKFILCTMDVPDPATKPEFDKNNRAKSLVVVDQHAADERVRVERLMKEMCVCSSLTFTPSLEYPINKQTDSEASIHRLDSMPLIPPLPITLSRREWRLADRYKDWLYRWGIALGKSASLPSMTNSQSPMLNMGRQEPGMEQGQGEAALISHHFQDTQEGLNGDPGNNDEALAQWQQRHQHQQAEMSRDTIDPYHVAKYDHNPGYVTVLPRVVADRCVVDTTLTQDLIKDCIGWAEEHQYSIAQGRLQADSVSDDTTAWLQCIRRCPRGILDIVNSKACRSAIMFNDELTIIQCQQVIKNLSQCVFPFQCAHGRPSIAPLTVLGPTLSRREQARQQKQQNLLLLQQQNQGSLRERCRSVDESDQNGRVPSSRRRSLFLGNNKQYNSRATLDPKWLSWKKDIL
ncbi:DNA mismatch repair protein [Lobosporangium transversale]|uniref:MutL C-terminal dimerisation domain-containing protein n=1 Tax=Lobosporangium transversale TaxID=64571 RepID=A0A1Y2GRJ7_9FUNG|nr:hypothetical protein BCR41DRAFT_421235 [Lobosporangium transversale]KAF9911328.1 DNA mismatch repair protein [Lobosporangium transversale]ORZ20143.1 hypothetical protein BCR41DRAFT_421235 [Lobosporangium transversale]|eukprot:XP_021882683.1 hypothetical protein BCR41DRAFT_421235 [Lobosporangium transversale]